MYDHQPAEKQQNSNPATHQRDTSPALATGEKSREQVDVLLLWLLAMRVRGAATGGRQLTTPYAAAGMESNCLTRFTNHQVTMNCLSPLDANLLERSSPALPVQRKLAGRLGRSARTSTAIQR
jgi:hypothetical protein